MLERVMRAIIASGMVLKANGRQDQMLDNIPKNFPVTGDDGVNDIEIGEEIPENDI